MDPLKFAPRYSGRKLRLAYFVSHPIQYQAPLLRRIAREEDIDLTVFFSSDHSARGYMDEGFGVKVTWDVPLLDGYRYEFLPRLRGIRGGEPSFSRPLNYGIFERLESGHFDVIWTHGYSHATTLRAILSARVLRLPALLRAESTLIDRPRGNAKLASKEAFFRFLRHHVSAVLAIGVANERYWRHYLGNDAMIFSMPYAVDNEFFQKRAETAAEGREELRQELGLRPGRPVILFASKLMERKRCADLISAYDQLSANGNAATAPYLLIVGDGEERARLEMQALRWPGIRFLGFRNQTELPRFFDLCDCFVLPSSYDPWGLVINEAMNAARAVVVSDQVGCQEDLVRDGVNGYVFRAGDTAALAAALARVLENPETAARMGEAGRARIAGYSFEQDVAGLRQALAACVPGFAAVREGVAWSPS